MKCPRLSRRWLLALAVLVMIPPALWALVLAIAPTDWARNRIVARLGELTGRSIALGHIEIGTLGGVHLTDLQIGAPASASDPWLKAGSARINVGMVQLLTGQFAPSEVEVQGLVLRVLRRRDGTLELADLLRPPSAASPGGTQKECPGGPAGLEVRLIGARITVIDEPSKTRIELNDVVGRAVWEGRQAIVRELRGTLNNGPFELSASIDRGDTGPQFEGRFHARNVALNGATSLLAYLVPVLAGTSESGLVDGRMELDFYVKGRGTSRDTLRRSVAGQGSVRIDPITLDGSRLLADLAKKIALPRGARVASVKGGFTIQNGRIGTDDMSLEVARVPIVLQGWTDFDRHVDYRVRADQLVKQLPNEAREFLADLAIDVKDVAPIRIEGTLDAMKVSLEVGLPGSLTGKGESARPLDDRQKMQELGRRFRDQFLR